MSYPSKYYLESPNPALIIQPNHQELVRYNHNVVCGVKFYLCQYGVSSQSDSGINSYDIWRQYDLSDYVIDYSYDCESSNNIKTSASVTLIRTPEVWETVWHGSEYKNQYFERSDDSGVYGTDTVANRCYELIKTYYFPDTQQEYEWKLGYFYESNNSENYSSTDEQLTISLINMVCLLEPEYGGTPNRFRQIHNKSIRFKKIEVDENTGEKKVTLGAPRLMTTTSCACPYLKQFTPVDTEMIYKIVMGSYAESVSFLDESAMFPIKGVSLGNNGQKTMMIIEDKEFSYDASRKDVLDYVVDSCYVDGHYWVDENNFLQIEGQQELRFNVALYREYGDLVIDEQRSYETSGGYNCVNVLSNVTIGGMEFTYFGRANFGGEGFTANTSRVLYIEDNTLQSNQECEERAKYECWRQMWGRETFTVSLEDNYIPYFVNPSTKVGKQIEYRTITGWTVNATIQKLSYSSNKITLTLKAFKPLYFAVIDVDPDTGVEEMNKTGKNTLASPCITGHEIVTNQYGEMFIRLNIAGTNAAYGIKRIINYPLGCAGEFVGNYADIPIDHNGVYKFQCQLISPFYEDSGYSSTSSSATDDAIYTVSVTSYSPPRINIEDLDPYPHPNMYANAYLTDEDDNKLTNENDERIYVKR